MASSASSLPAEILRSIVKSPKTTFVPARADTKIKEVKKNNFLHIIILLQKSQINSGFGHTQIPGIYNKHQKSTP
jgi:hypothetical protein